MKIDLSSPWHYLFFRRHIETVAKCRHCGHGLTEADLESGVCPSCKKPLKIGEDPTRLINQLGR